MRETHKTFLQYHRRVSSRLARHYVNTDSTPINLVMDIKQQDKFTTWMEYLSFELSHHDRDTWYSDCEAEYHENWGLLLEANVLQEGETREYIESTDYILVRDVETMRARSAVEVLMEKILAGQRGILEVGQEGVLDPALKTAGPFVELRDAEVELLEACDKLKLQKRRAKRIAEYLDATLAYRLARRRVHRSTLLLNWIREQVPLIRREMAIEEAYQADQDRENQDPAQVFATTEVPAAIKVEDFGLIDLSTPASTPFVLTCDDFSTREGSLAPAIADSGVIDSTSGALLMPTFPDPASRESSESPESPPAEEAGSSTYLSGASKRSRSDDGTEDGEPKRLRGNTQSPPPATEQADPVLSHRPPRDALTYANRLIGSGRLQHAQPWVEGHEDILEQYGNLRESYGWNGVREQGAGRSSVWDVWAGGTNARRDDENDETKLEPDLDGRPPWGTVNRD
ncbi:hypothetical protein QQZ08_010018 [Neonectria magnoliae]|uniref:Uncharacterized protein n=1 Tax=Neonectria magnoliae TaxID=2732573 RepID=A0ABR1HJG3_9HYPO